MLNHIIGRGNIILTQTTISQVLKFEIYFRFNNYNNSGRCIFLEIS